MDVCPGGTITFDGNYTITLASTLTISTDLTIDGTGHSVTIDGNHTVGVFSIDSGITATLNSPTVANGHASNGGFGTPGGTGGDAGFGGNGGGIYNNGTLTVVNCTFSANSAGDGGTGGDTNPSDGIGGPGGIGGIGGVGGGIYNSGTTTVVNCTVSGNSVGDGGIAGIGGSGGPDGIDGVGGNGGGIYVASSAVAVTVTNSIIALQTSGSDCVGTITTGGHNIESATTCGFTGPGDQQSVTSGQLNLGALADNGGPTFTMALGTGSVALDAGDNTVCAAPPVNNLD